MAASFTATSVIVSIDAASSRREEGGTTRKSSPAVGSMRPRACDGRVVGSSPIGSGASSLLLMRLLSRWRESVRVFLPDTAGDKETVPHADIPTHNTKRSPFAVLVAV